MKPPLFLLLVLSRCGALAYQPPGGPSRHLLLTRSSAVGSQVWPLVAAPFVANAVEGSPIPDTPREAVAQVRGAGIRGVDGRDSSARTSMCTRIEGGGTDHDRQICRSRYSVYVRTGDDSWLPTLQM